ncbi:hypothetical protein B9G69_004955 [Bdellovibrio sp. SKB1291214]|uniref:hypothetical protein n=1 Tax=Bdellovibrio sp. SKB1291214 TaxID=1732569 RepID=UPI000B515CCD|nr:hypothetical protein [Bdellovibrio sp. SKB1291214]UYL09923.1 hypothetical protein B9G69_004955 [Bdellovibrio sp. SKB1291214]
MKKIVLSLLTLVLSQAASAGAITQNSSWEEILAAKAPYVVHAPAVYMGRAISYTYVCRDGENLRTKGPVDTVVTNMDGTNRKATFTTVRSEVLSTPINFVQHEDFCDSTEARTLCYPVTYTGTYPMTVEISVGRKLNKGREVHLFTKSYTVPDCDNASVN